MAEIKSGRFSTEFWLTIILVILGKLSQGLTLVLSPDNIWILVIGLASGFVIDLGALLGYTISRGLAKSAVLPFMLICLIGGAALLPGCALFDAQEVSPSVHVANVRSVYIAAVRTMTDLGAQGFVTLELAEEFESVRIRVASGLAAADAAVANGFEFEFADLASSIETMRDLLSIAIAVARGGN